MRVAPAVSLLAFILQTAGCGDATSQTADAGTLDDAAVSADLGPSALDTHDTATETDEDSASDSSEGSSDAPEPPVDVEDMVDTVPPVDTVSAPDADPADDTEPLPDSAGAGDVPGPPAECDGCALLFVQLKGDDGAVCAGTDHCGVGMPSGAERNLDVRLIGADGMPAAGLLEWEVTKGQGDGLSLAFATTATALDGTSTQVVSHSGKSYGKFEIRVNVIDHPGAGILWFDLVVEPKSVVPLTVSYTTPPGSPVVSVTTWLYKMTPAETLSCASVDFLALPAADVVSPPFPVDEPTVFTGLPDLLEEGTQAYTIVGLGADADGVVQAGGCNDGGVSISYENAVGVGIELVDTP